MLLSDKKIRELCVSKYDVSSPLYEKPILEPFSEAVSGNGIISYGLTSAGYDIRLGPEIYVFNNCSGEEVDPKRFNEEEYKDRMFYKIYRESGHVTIPANSYILGRSLEYIRIPRHLKGKLAGKSTYARSGIIINTTDIEPEWHGNLVIEIANASPCPCKVYIGEGIGQIDFYVLDGRVEISYADKGGKYQGQTGITVAKVL